MPTYGPWIDHGPADTSPDGPGSVQLRQFAHNLQTGALGESADRAVLHDYPEYGFEFVEYGPGEPFGGIWTTSYRPDDGGLLRQSAFLRLDFPSIPVPEVEVPEGSWVEFSFDTEPQSPFSVSFQVLWGFPHVPEQPGETVIPAYASIHAPDESVTNTEPYTRTQVMMWPPVDATAWTQPTPAPWDRRFLNGADVVVPIQSVRRSAGIGRVDLIAVPYSELPDGTGDSGGRLIQGSTFSLARWFVGTPTFHWQPFQYRIVTPDVVGGIYRTRQRQSLAGSDSWPARQRQNGSHTGSWPTRQRQRGL